MPTETEGRWLLPEGWRWATVGEIAKVVGGGTPKANVEDNFAEPGSGVAWITPADLTGYDEVFIGSGRRDLSPEGLKGSSARMLPKGTVLFSSRAPIGYCAVAANPIATNQGFKSLILKPGLDPEFVRLYLLASTEYAELAASGTTFKELSGARMKGLLVPVAPAPEQERIVTRFNSIEAHRRAAAEKLDRLPDLLDRYRQSVLAAAFRGDLTAAWRDAHPDTEPASALLDRIRAERRRRWAGEGRSKAYKEPKAVDRPDAPTAEVYGGIEGAGWVSAPLELLADPVRGIPYGIVQTGKHVEGGVATVRCGDVKRFSIDTAALKRVDPEIHAKYARTVLEGGEVLVAIRGTVGATAVAGPDMAGMNISREVAMIPPLPGVDPHYLAYLLASPAGQALMAGQVVGVAQSGINLGDLRRLPTALPPEAEQAEVVRLVSAAMDRIDALEDTVRRRLADLDTLRQSTLARAFRGELVPTNAALARRDGRPAPAAPPTSGAGRGGRQGRGEAQTALDL